MFNKTAIALLLALTLYLFMAVTASSQTPEEFFSAKEMAAKAI